MNVGDLLQQAQDAVSVRRVFGEAYERDGVTVIPVAYVAGGGGGGSGTSGPAPMAEGGEVMAKPQGSGGGLGFGLTAYPAGVYVIQNGTVRWRPALNVNLLVVVAGLVLLAALRAAGGAPGARRKGPR